MFKKNKVAAGVAAGILGVVGIISSAQAVHVNPDGTGQVLVFPYFIGKGNYLTNINIVNSTDKTKAVKIRFREARNSNDVLDFNIYMSPEDVWTGAVKQGFNADGKAVGALSTTDRTCTLPSLASCEKDKCEVTIPFSGFGIYKDVTQEDTKEGYIEVIEMGVVEDPVVQKGVKHVNGVPNNCKAVEDAWRNGVFTQGEGAAAKGMSAPTGGLFGSSAVINIEKGAAFAVDPVAIDNYSTRAQHYLSDDEDNFLLPSLASGDVKTSSIMVKNASGQGEMVVTEWNEQKDACLEDGDPLTPRCGTNPYPIAHALLAPHLMNEYFVDPSNGYDGHTDWVVTFPMKKHGIHKDVAANFENGIFDREETKAVFNKGSGKPNTGFGFSPVKPGKKPESSVFSREVNVITFKTTDPAYDDKRTVLSSYASQSISVGPFVHGWARLGFTNNDLKAGFKSAKAYGANPGTYTADSNLYKGVPAIGAAFIEGNISANPNARFGDALPHKVQR